jgi:anaerobic selenocysteine-containing dehydrogenase
MSPKSHACLNSSDGNLPEQLQHAGEQTLLLHPQDANMRGTTNGAVVRVFNDRGAFAAVAMITDDVMPGVVVAPLGYWRRLSRAQATAQAVNSGKYADLGHAPTFSDNLVEVALAAAGR